MSKQAEGARHLQGYFLLLRADGVDGVRWARGAHRHLPEKLCRGQEVDEHDRLQRAAVARAVPAGRGLHSSTFKPAL